MIDDFKSNKFYNWSILLRVLFMNQIKIDYEKNWLSSAMLACMVLLLMVPFAISGRYAIYGSLYQDFTVIALGLVAVLLAIMTKSLRMSIPRVSYVLLAMSAYWLLQPVFTDVIYSDSNIKASIIFVLFAVVAWSIHSLIDRAQLIIIIAWALLIGANLQALVVVLQAVGVNFTIFGLFDISAANGLEGQLGQRNLLAHYLCWGVISGSYLTARGGRGVYISGVLTIVTAIILGLISSRSIILYGSALLIIAGLQAVYQRVSHQNHTNHTTKWLIAIGALILIPQLLMPTVLSVFNISTESGLQRVLSNGSDMARWYEMKKAFLGFLQAPLFGHGWNASIFQSFFWDFEVVPVEYLHSGQIAEHSHNIITELLVEMGIVGTFLVVLGAIWALIPLVKSSLKLESCFILALLTVTALHSMVEYPLWNTYFLMAVVIFLSAAPSKRDERTVKSIYQLPILITTLVCMCVVSFFMVIYQKNYSIYAADTYDEESKSVARSNAFYSVFLKLPLFLEDKDKLTIQNMDITADNYSDEQINALVRYSEYMPTPQATQYRGMYEYKIGHHKVGLDWLQRSWHYYPSQLPQSMVFIYNAHPALEGLEQAVYDACLRYQNTHFYENLQTCPTPPSTW